jgi:tetratricopeptide (TPR) repeat protein
MNILSRIFLPFKRVIDFFVRIYYGVMEQLEKAFSHVLSFEGLPGFGRLLLIFSLFSAWFVSPLQDGVKCYSIPLSGSFSLRDAIQDPWRIFSYGSLILALLLFEPLYRRIRVDRIGSLLLGCSAVFLPLLFFMQVLFVNPVLSEEVVWQNNELMRMKQFDQAIMEGTAGAVRVSDLASDTFLDRLDLVVRRTGFGAYLSLCGGILILAFLFRSDKRKWFGKVAAFALTLLFLIIAVTGYRSIIGDYCRGRAINSAAEGDLERSLLYFQRARSVNPELDENLSFLSQYGRVQYMAGVPDAPEVHLYVGSGYLDDGRFLQAKERLLQAVSSGPMRDVLRRMEALVLIREGLDLYGRGYRSAAASLWERASQFSEESVEAHFYLGYAYFEIDTDVQTRALSENLYILDGALIEDRIMKAEVLTNVGDCYFKAGRFKEARKYYRRSLNTFNLVKVINFRAQRGLIGL